MKYLIYSNKEDAKLRNKEIATALGCGKNGDTTTEWFSIIKHPKNNYSAFVIPEEYEKKLSLQEKNEFKDFNFMEKEGWFELEVTEVEYGRRTIQQ